MKRGSGNDKPHDKPRPKESPHPKDEVTSDTLQQRPADLETRNNTLIETLHDMEESLKECADLLDFAPVGFLILNKDGLVKYANSTAANLLGVRKTRLIAKPFTFFMIGESRERFRLHLWSVSNSGMKQDCIVQLGRSDDSLFDARLESVISEADKNMIFATISDISVQKKADDALRCAYGELRGDVSGGGARRKEPLRPFTPK